jgi:serine/threonine-protein kinase RsbW
MENQEIRFVIESDLKNVSQVGKTVKEVCSLISDTPITPYELELCVIEAVNNSIEHAYGNEKGQEVEVRFALQQDRIVVEIQDTGKSMDQRVLEETDVSMLVTSHEDLNTLAEQGRGLPIIKKLMDAVVYETRQGKNCLTMTKFFE